MTDAEPAAERPGAARAPASALPAGAAESPGTGALAARSDRLVLALGSNLGDRLQNLQGAVDAFFDAQSAAYVAISPVYETEPVGGPPQPDYLNAVLLAATARPAMMILELVQGIEKAFHRSREVRWGPRTLDIDIITCGTQVSDDPMLTLPHPRAHERAFVLAPWLDIDPDAEIPGRGRVADLLTSATGPWLRRRDDIAIRPPD